MSASPALTIGVIAERLHRPLHRVEYVIKSRRISPYQRAGNLRIFAEADVQFIESELRRMDAEREGVCA